ncbi:MAG: DUF2802 domain-containing protein [Pseudobdellovibrionaceae bacterium]
MNFWILCLLLVNLGLLGLLIKQNLPRHKKPEDNPELQRGLQLIQSKIAIVEDFSDRTENLVQQLTAIMEQKRKDLQNKIEDADKQLQKINMAMKKSLEVADIFQDKIPHEEIMQRQNTIKYVKAARMAHQGLSIDEIAQQLQMIPAEIELIVKMNKDNLVFCEDSLPEWVQHGLGKTSEPDDFTMKMHNLSEADLNAKSGKDTGPVDMDQIKQAMKNKQNINYDEQQAFKDLSKAFASANSGNWNSAEDASGGGSSSGSSGDRRSNTAQDRNTDKGPGTTTAGRSFKAIRTFDFPRI